MTVRILCVGKLKEAYFEDACAEFQKRLSRFCSLELIEVPDEKAPESLHPADERNVLDREGEKLVLVREGKSGKGAALDEIAAFLEEKELSARPLTFVIGGSLGLSAEVYARADAKLSFSQMTFPHRIARLLLLEQLYRGFKIRRNEAYHK